MPEHQKNARILIVEDEVLIAADLEIRLTGLGYTVCAKATTGEKALRLVEEHQPDLVMMDIVLQGEMDGIDAAEVIREKWGIPVVFLTAYADADRLELVKLTYPFGYLLKPFQDRGLKVTLEMALYVAKVDTGRRVAEYELKKTKDNLELTLNSILDGLIVCDSNFRFTYIGPIDRERIRKSGRDPNTLPGKLLWEEYPHLVGTIAEEKLRYVMEERLPDSYETTFNGRWYECRIFPTADGGISILSPDITDRKRNEEEMRQMARQLRSLGDSLPGGTIYRLVHDPGGHKYFDYVSAGFELIFELSTEAVAQDATLLYMLVHPEDRNGALEAQKQSAENLTPLRYECRFILPSGKIRWIRWHSMPERLPNDGLAWNGVALDITESKHLEKMLGESEKRFRLLAENASDTIWMMRLDGAFTYHSPSVEKLRGYTPEEANRIPMQETMPPESLSYIRRMFEDEESKPMAERWADRTIELETYRKDGSIMWTDVSIRAIRDEKGNVVGLQGSARDITDRKQGEEELRESQERFQLAFDNANIGMCLVDLEGRLIKVNRQMASIFGYSQAELEGMTVNDIAYPEDVNISPKFMSRAVSGDIKHARFEKRYIRKDGSLVWCHVASSIVHDQDGAPMYFISHVQDITEQKRFEEALVRSKREWTEIFQAIGHPTLILDPQHRILDANRAALSATGKRIDELRGKICHEFFHGTAEPPAGCPTSRARQTGSFEEANIEMETIEGMYMVACTPVFDAQGNLEKVIHVSTDITERKKAEDELKHAEQRYRSLFEEAPAMYIITHNMNGVPIIKGCNKSFLEALGYPRAEVVGRPLADFYTPESRYRLLEGGGYQKALTNPIVDVERELVAADGRVIRTLLRAGPEKDILGDVIGTRGMFMDITERRRVEQALKESEEKYRHLFESESDAILLIERETGNILEANRAAVNLFGFGREELLSLKNTDLSAEPEKTIGDMETGNEVVPGRLYRKKDGTIFPVEISRSYFLWKDIPVYIAAVRDITRRRKAEEEKEKLEAQYRQAQKLEAVGRLAGGVAHDFNNMLSIIIGNTQLAMDDAGPALPIHESLQEILTAARRSADLTRQLLAFARKQTVSPKLLDLNETVASMLKMLQRLIGEDIELVWKPGAALWPVMMDPTQVDQILANLAVNARDAIAGVGNLTIETGNVVIDETYVATHPDFLPGEYILLALSDTGCGIDRDDLAHVFEPFYTTKEEGKGTGLGLATVYGIVKQNNGFIEVYSEPGVGTTFKIYLPRTQTAMASDAVPDVRMIARGTETLMMVEDEATILKLGQAILERHGYTVLTAKTPSEAITLVERHEGRIHLLVTDVVMPEMNGKELRDRLVGLRPDLKTLFMSGYTVDVIAHHGVLEEGVHFLQKPFSINSLTAKVREVLDH